MFLVNAKAQMTTTNNALLAFTASQKTMDNQLGNISQSLSAKPSGSLPSQHEATTQLA
jgi:hypothetical protein